MPSTSIRLIWSLFLNQNCDGTSLIEIVYFQYPICDIPMADLN